MMDLLDFLTECVLFFFPRFVTDRVALTVDDDGVWSVFCLEGDEREGDDMIIECYGSIKTFTWLGFTRGGMVNIDY